MQYTIIVRLFYLIDKGGSMNNLLWFSLMCWIFSRDKSSSSASSLSIADRLAKMTPKERSIDITKIMIAIILAVIAPAIFIYYRLV